MRAEKEKKSFGFGIKLRIIAEMQNEGYTDINDYIDALKEQILKLQETNKVITEALQEANMKLDKVQQPEAAPDAKNDTENEA